MFAYCGNNPVNGCDPSGHFWVEIEDFIEDVCEAIGDAAEETWNGIMTVSGYCCYGLSKVFSFVGLSGLAKGERWLSKKYLHIAGTRIIPNIENMDLRPFTKENFRENLEIYTQRAGIGFVAHHVIPKEFAAPCEVVGIDFNSPIFGTWVTQAHHEAIHYYGHYNQRWNDFFSSNQNLTADQILNFADELANEFGFEVYYNG